MVSVDVKHHVYLLTLPLSTPLCPPGDQSVSDAFVTWLCNYYAPPPVRRGLIVTQVGAPFVRWAVTLQDVTASACLAELRNCVKVEVAVLGSRP